MSADPVPLVEVLRGGVLESLHRGSVAVCDASGKVLKSAGDPGTVAFWRSAMKPLQAMAFAESGALEAFGLGEEALAVACGSHAAEDRHIALVTAMLAAAGLSEKDLGCGTHAPSRLEGKTGGIRLTAFEKAVEGGERYDARHNNCSGKHSGMLLGTKRKGLDLKTYLDPEHPHQVRIREIALAMTGASSLTPAVDGCSAPVYPQSLAHMATAYARLTRPPKALEASASRVAKAMLAHPFFVSGTERFDTDLMEAGKGKVLSKGGAEGVLCMALPEQGWGVALKIEDGAQRGTWPAAMEVLRQLGAGVELPRHARQEVLNVKKRVVGEMRPASFRLL